MFCGFLRHLKCAVLTATLERVLNIDLTTAETCGVLFLELILPCSQLEGWRGGGGGGHLSGGAAQRLTLRGRAADLIQKSRWEP